MSVNAAITRQSAGQIWEKKAGKWKKVAERAFPGKDESPNDDSSTSDEDNVPQNNHIYSIDGPGFSEVATADEKTFHANFYEYVRVRFSRSFKNRSGLIEGSRCSDKALWNSRIRVKKGANGKWKRNNANKKDNQIEEGHVKVNVP